MMVLLNSNHIYIYSFIIYFHTIHPYLHLYIHPSIHHNISEYLHEYLKFIGFHVYINVAFPFLFIWVCCEMFPSIYRGVPPYRWIQPRRWRCAVFLRSHGARCNGLDRRAREVGIPSWTTAPGGKTRGDLF